jgi:DNA-binding transcriptional LysR family regulator
VEIEDRHLRQVVTLASVGSFGRAALRLGLSQPALTRSIQGIERALGVSLFERHRRGVTPTRVGQAFVARAEEVLRELADLSSELDLIKGLGEGTVSLGAGPAPAARLVPLAIGRLCDRWPRLRVQVVRGHWKDLTQALFARALDLFVAERSEAEQDPRLEVVPLASELGIWVCRAGHPLLGRGPVELAELARFPVAVPTLPDRMPEALRAFSSSGWIRCDDVSLLKQVVLASDAVGLQSRHTASPELEVGKLRELAVHGLPTETRPGVVSVRGRALSPAAARLIDELRAADAYLAGERAPEPD